MDDPHGFCPPGAAHECEEFKECIDNCGPLCWDFKEPLDKVNFLGVIISIRDNGMHMMQCEKALNLHLCVPPQSEHAPGIFAS